MGSPVPRALLFVDLVDSTALVEKLGDTKAADVFAEFDHLARASFAGHGGREIDRTDGFLVLFERPVPAVAAAFELHAIAASLSLSARAAIHFGDVVLRENPPEDVARGAKPLEVDGLAKPVGARLLSLALPGQTLLSPVAVELAKRAQWGGELPAATRFLDHGAYQLKGVSEPIHLYEAGLEGKAPLRAPPGAAKGGPVRGRGRVLFGIAAVAALAGTAAVYVTRRPVGPPPIPSYHERRLLSLPADQELSGLALNDDGTKLVYVQHGELKTMALPDGDPQPFPFDVGGRVQWVDVIPPDNDLLVVVRTNPGNEIQAPVVRVSSVTGTVTPLPWTAQRAWVSADGRRAVLQKHEDGLWIGDLESGRSRRIGPEGTGGWSPDGNNVVEVVMSDQNELLRIAADGSSTTSLLKAQILDRYELGASWIDPTTIWMPLHRTVGDNRSGGIERVRLDPATGQVIGRDTVRDWPDEKVAGLDVARGRDLWVAARATTQDEVFVMDVGPDGLPTGAPKNVTRHRRSDRPTDWLPDGRVVFTSDRSGVFDLYAQRPDGDEAARLAAGPALQTWGRVTHSGALLYWEIVPADTPAEVQRARVVRDDLADGTPPQTVLEIDIESALRLSGRPPPFSAWFTCARDVEICALSRLEGDRYTTRLFDPGTGTLGEPVHQVFFAAESNSPWVQLSPDGKQLARVFRDTITLVSLADRSEKHIRLPGFSDLQYVAWRPDGQSVYVTGWLFDEEGRRCVVAFVDLRDGRAVPVRIADSWRGQVTVSWDGSRIAWLEWDGSNDVYLYEREPS